MTPEHKKSLAIGICLALFSSLCLSSANALVKLMGSPVPKSHILLLQNLFGIVVIYALILRSKKKISLRSPHYGLLFLRAMAGLGAFFFVYIAVQKTTVANATLFLNTAPFFIPFIALVTFKEKIAPLLWYGIAPGFLGIILILNPSADAFNWYSLLPLISGLSIALIFTSLRQLHHHKEPVNRILFYLFFFSALVCLPFSLFNWTDLPWDLWCLLGLTAITSFLAQTTLTIALRFGSPKTLAPLTYTSVVFALFFDWLLWQHVPTLQSLLGILLVIAGGVTAVILETRKMKKI